MIDIDTLEMIEGDLPRRALDMVKGSGRMARPSCPFISFDLIEENLNETTKEKVNK